MKEETILPDRVHTTKLVHGGQALGTLEDGRKIFVWNALPGEVVQVRVIKKRRTYVEGIAETILQASPERIEPEESHFLAASPWQMMTFAAENEAKQAIVTELLHQQHVSATVLPTIHDDRVFHYRNKMEYGFWGDDDGLHLAAYKRGSHGKQIITGSKLAMPALDAAAEAIRAALHGLSIWAGELKTVIVRCDQTGKTVASLFVKNQQFPKRTLPSGMQGLRVYYSNPKSPASVPTELLQELGDCMLADTLAGHTFHYDSDSFFQINLPVFDMALGAMAAHTEGTTDLVDMYGGVGSIGLSIATKSVDIVELDPYTAAMARRNAEATSLQVRVIEASAEQSLTYITSDKPLAVDPPRAGLHPRVVAEILRVQPPRVLYLSCNPATQARDLALLQDRYDIGDVAVFNFFPRTPHIEALAYLTRKG